MSSSSSIGFWPSFAYKARRSFAFFRREAVGVVRDFWKDGNGETPALVQSGGSQKHAGTAADDSAKNVRQERGLTWNQAGLWRAAPGEISEKMWGDGSVSPADAYIDDLLIKPMNLAKGMSMLDLAAGLGLRMRKANRQSSHFF